MGWGCHHFFVYPKGGGHQFYSFDKGGGKSCVFVRCFAGSYRPPSGRNNERSPVDVKDLRVVEWVALIRFLSGMCHY